MLEISATPYIFTFKMYDWLRLGLDGLPRPLNIDRAFDNLCFERQGDEVARQLVSQPTRLPAATIGDSFICRRTTNTSTTFIGTSLKPRSSVDTNGSPHVLMLVEGSSLLIETADGMRERFNFVETFVVPAAAGSYKLINQGEGRAKVVKAFMKSFQNARTVGYVRFQFR